jgi:uncharacterized membrane protein YeaQ/YmgE (transglycosylase-associated protein family)
MLWNILIFLAVGLLAGWIAGLIWKGKGFGLLGNLIIGVAGSFIGGFLFRLIGLPHGTIIWSIVAALAGALILLVIINLIRRKL